MRKKKLLSLALAAVMVAGLLTGCGNDNAASTTPSTDGQVESEAPADSTEEADVFTPDFSEPVALKLWLEGNTVSDDSDVMEAINAYPTEKINATLDVTWGTWGDFDENASTSLKAGDDVDMYFTCSWTLNEYNQFSKDGCYVRLDDPENNLIATYGADIWNALPDVLKEGAMIEGSDGYGVYAVPGFKDFGTQNTWDINVTLLEELGFTLDDIKATDYYGFGEFLEAAKVAKGDDFYPLNIEPAVLERMVTNTVIVNGDSGDFNVLSYYIDPTDVSTDLGSKIVNKFATDEYKKFAEQTRAYYNAGYIDPRAASAQTSNECLVEKQNNAQYLIGTQSYALGYEYTASAARGIHVEFVPCTPPYVDKTSTQGAMVAISAYSKNPERAMAFLNLLNTDPKLMTLLAYGVEGTHYTKNDDGTINLEAPYNDGVYRPWRNGVGNITLLPPTADEGVNFFTDTFIPYYSEAKAIPAFGYAFNSEPVADELAAIANVAAQYGLALDAGSVDPATELPAFLEKLEAAGMQKVVDEANAQLDAYFASAN